jgi:hypothetical protein
MCPLLCGATHTDVPSTIGVDTMPELNDFDHTMAPVCALIALK